MTDEKNNKPIQIQVINNLGLKIYSMLLLNKETLWVGSGDGAINVFNVKVIIIYARVTHFEWFSE